MISHQPPKCRYHCLYSNTSFVSVKEFEIICIKINRISWILLGKIPSCNTSSNDQVLTCNTELGDPESSQDVIPTHPEHEGVRDIFDVGGATVNFWMISCENPEASIQPHNSCDSQGKKCLHKVFGNGSFHEMIWWLYQKWYKNKIWHSMDCFASFMEQGNHESYSLPKDE